VPVARNGTLPLATEANIAALLTPRSPLRVEQDGGKHCGTDMFAHTGAHSVTGEAPEQMVILAIVEQGGRSGSLENMVTSHLHLLNQA
jgi:hypothetical protein